MERIQRKASTQAQGQEIGQKGRIESLIRLQTYDKSWERRSALQHTTRLRSRKIWFFALASRLTTNTPCVPASIGGTKSPCPTWTYRPAKPLSVEQRFIKLWRMVCVSCPLTNRAMLPQV